MVYQTFGYLWHLRYFFRFNQLWNFKPLFFQESPTFENCFFLLAGTRLAEALTSVLHLNLCIEIMVTKYKRIAILKLNWRLCIVVTKQGTQKKSLRAGRRSTLVICSLWSLSACWNMRPPLCNRCLRLLRHCRHIRIMRTWKHIWLLRVDLKRKRLIMYSYEVFRPWWHLGWFPYHFVIFEPCVVDI